MTLQEWIQDLAAAERKLLHLRARRPEGGVVLRLPLLGGLQHRLVHRHKLVRVTSMLDGPVLLNPLVETFEGKDLFVDAVNDEPRQL